MKKSILLSTILLSIVSVSFVRASYAQEPLEPSETRPLLPEYVFVPPGFDDNDEAQVIVAGYLPNTCYRASSPEAEKREDGSILIKNSAYYWNGCFCLDVLVPYTHSVSLKQLKAGDHTVVSLNGKGDEVAVGLVPVSEATKAEPDDRPYAPVSELESTVVRRSDGSYELTLKGEFPLSCHKLKEKVEVKKRVPGVIEVLPEYYSERGARCESGRFPFEAKMVIADSLKAPTLVHIRTMSGNAINRVIGL